MSSFELGRTFSENEDISLQAKLEVLKDSLEAELNRIAPFKAELNYISYERTLIRLKKFFSFRERLLQHKASPKMDLGDLITKLSIFDETETSLDQKRLAEFFQEYTEDIFFNKLLFRLRSTYDPDGYDEIQKLVTRFDGLAFGDSTGTYFTRVVRSFARKIETSKQQDYIYSSIRAHLDGAMPRYDQAFFDTRVIELQNFIKGFLENGGVYQELIFNCSYLGSLKNAPKELMRRLLNGIISRICDVSLSDDVPQGRFDQRFFTTTEFRILLYVRNKNFHSEDFFRFFDDILEANSNKPLDSNVMEAVPYFNAYIGDANLIDDLILVHDYTTAVWKQGSKHLHFYTLHNQEHAIELIKASVQITKSIRHLHLSKLDYYVLFIGCYLHDISMAIHPDLKSLFLVDGFRSDMLVSKFKADLRKDAREINTTQKSRLKEVLLNYYKYMDTFFENHVRSTHATDSADFIRTADDLDFLEDIIRDLVAEVSAAHGYKTPDIYGIKSRPDSEVINKKYIQIVLRLADLFDMADDRISEPVLRHNHKYMSDITRFHWLSHQAIAGYELESRYANSKLEEDLREKSYLEYGNLEENVYLTIYLNAWQEEFVCSPTCLFNYLEDQEGHEDNIYLLKIADSKEVCHQKKCLFICRWITQKHAYLFEELYALQKYLASCDNYFKTQFMVQIKAKEGAKPLKGEEYKLVRNEIIKD